MDGYKSPPEMQLVLLQKLSILWLRYPELRFGQLVACVVKDQDLFSVFNEEFLLLLEDFADEHTTDSR